jgi:hypothetical protein
MTQRRRSEKQMQETLALVAEHGSVVKAATAAGIGYPTLQSRYAVARAWLAEKKAAAMEQEELPSSAVPIVELLDQRSKDFQRKHEAIESRRLINIKVKIAGPIGIAHVGDPHVDDDGTNIPLLREHVDIIDRTEGLFAGNVGDLTNNWIGRLARLYAQQRTSASDAWALAEWLVNALRWIYIIGGNHDCWSGAGDPLKWICRQGKALYEPHGVRLALQFPNGREVRINARHTFPGHSMWNTAHGPSRAAQMGWRDHVLTCGHTHVSGYQVLKDPSSGLITHALRVASYKQHDEHAEALGLPDQNIFCCPVTIIDPSYPDGDPRLITTIFDPGEAADYLTWKRRRKAS